LFNPFFGNKRTRQIQTRPTELGDGQTRQTNELVEP